MVRSVLLWVFTGSERLPAELSDNICAESHFRLRLTGVRAPSAEPNRIRIPAYIRACVRVRVHAPPPHLILLQLMLRRASVLARLHKRAHVSAAQRGSAGGELGRNPP